MAVEKGFKEEDFARFHPGGKLGQILDKVVTLGANDVNSIEFGVADYLESNTRFLLINNNWSGFVM